MKTYEEFQSEKEQIYKEAAEQIVADSAKDFGQSVSDETIFAMATAVKIFEYRLHQYHNWLCDQLADHP